MHFGSQRGKRQTSVRKTSFFICIGIGIGLISVPTIVSALPNLLKVTVDTVWTDEVTTIQGVTASFPYYVLSRVKVYDEFNQYVPKLASQDRWLSLNDYTDGGQPVRDAWRTTLEYHAENNAIPDNPNVKSNPDYFGVTEVRMYDYDMSMMLVMDYSRSMDDMSVVEEATLNLVREIGGRDPLGIVKFSTKVKVAQTLTQDTLLLTTAITDSMQRDQTALYASIDTAITHLQYQPGRRVVVVYTDGKNDDYLFPEPTLDDVIERAKQKNVELFVIGLGGGINADRLKQLASQTGGKYFWGETPKRLDSIFLKVYGDLRGYYIMRHLSTDPFHNGTWRTVEVQVVEVWKGGTGKCKYYVPYYPTDVRVSKSVFADSMIYHPGGQSWYSMASDTATFTIQLENKGKGSYREIQIVDVLDDSLVALSNDMVLGERIALESLDEHQVSWTIPRLDAGATVELQYKAKLDSIMPMNSMALTNHVQLYGDSAFTVGSAQAVVNGYGKPDFTINCISPGVIASRSQNVTLKAEILNQGNAHADIPFRISFEYQGQVLDYDTLQTLNIGVPTNVTGVVSFPALGDYQVLVRADADQAIQELDEANNTDVCTLNVHITDIGVQISDVNYRDTMRGVRARFPADLLTTVNVWDQNNYPVYGLSSAETWSNLEDDAPVSEPVGDIWESFHETYRDIPGYPSDSNIRPDMQVTEFTNSSASWVLMVSTGGVPTGWLDMVEPALISMTTRMQNGDRVAIMASHGSASTTQSFTNNGNSIKQGIEQLSNGSGSRLWDNLIAAIDMAAGRSGRNGVIAVLGGNDQGSNATVDEVIAHAQEYGVPLYMLGLKNQTDASTLSNLALATGGCHWSFEDKPSLQERAGDAERLLRNYYVLHHESSDTLKNLSWRQLDIDIAAHGFTANDSGIYKAPRGIYDVALEKTLYSKTFQIDEGDTVWTVQPGDSAWCTIQIINEGDFPMYNIALEDSMSNNVFPRSALFATFTANPNRLEWTIDTLLVGESEIFKYRCFVDTLSQLVETDLVSRIQLSVSGDEISSNNIQRDTLRYNPLLAADVSIQKQATGDSLSIVNGDTTWYVYPQGTVTYQITIQNHGEMPAKSIEVKDALPQYLEWLYTTRTLSDVQNDTLIWQIPRLNGHDAKFSWTYTCRVDSLMPPWDVPLVNSVSVYSSDDATPDNNMANDSVTAIGIAPPWPNIDVTPSLIYPQDLVDVFVISPFSVASWDLEVIYGDGTSSDTYGDAFIDGSILNPNEMIQIQPDFAETTQHTANAEETVQIILKTTDIWNVTRNDTASFVITLPDVVITKRIESDSLRIVNGDSLWYADYGETVNYTVTLTNQGKLPCHSLQIQDVLAPHLTFLQFDDQTSYTSQGDTLSWQLDTLNGFYDQVQYHYTCQVSSIMPPWVEEELNTVSVTCDRDRDLSNNKDEALLYAVGDIPSDPGVLAMPGQVEPGDSIQVYVVSPIEILPGDWYLTIQFEDGETIDDYAKNYTMNHGLSAGDTIWIRPGLGDTRMRTNQREEQLLVILETIDDWQASYFDTASVTLRSGDAFALSDNVFRPSLNGTLRMRFQLSTNRHAKIVVYDISGVYIETVIDGPYLAGWNEAIWDGYNRYHHQVGSGVYIALYSSGDVKKANKFIVVR